MIQGTIIRVAGPVVDVQFTAGKLPALQEALTVTAEGTERTMEVTQHVNETTVRCIMLSASEGLGKGIPVGYAFRRIWEGGHGTRSQHYAGVSFDVGQSLTRTARTAIYNAARGTGAWGYVEPLSQTPTWVHMDRRYGTPACSGTTAGYPTLRRGSRGCYVMILQDALSTLGYQTGSRIDGIFGARTEEALKGFQRRTSLRVDGVCGCNSWKKISTAVIGVGRTKTTID